MTEFHTIVSDPPCLERGGGKYKRGADRHYPLLREHQIIEAILTSGVWFPAPDCHLYQWATSNHLEEGLRIMKALGFRYVTNVVWVKDRIGLGQYFRGQHELCLFGVRGRQPSLVRSTPSVIHAPRKAHSSKPESFFELVERTSPGPYLELFSRAQRQGWTCWGNEVLEVGSGGNQ